MQARRLDVRLWYIPVNWMPVCFFFTWPKSFVFWQVSFPLGCMCLPVCLSVCLCVRISVGRLSKKHTKFFFFLVQTPFLFIPDKNFLLALGTYRLKHSLIFIVANKNKRVKYHFTSLHFFLLRFKVPTLDQIYYLLFRFRRVLIIYF